MDDPDCAGEGAFGAPEDSCAEASSDEAKHNVSMEIAIPKLKAGNRFIALRSFTFRSLNIVSKLTYVDSFCRSIDAKDGIHVGKAANFGRHKRREEQKKTIWCDRRLHPDQRRGF